MACWLLVLIAAIIVAAYFIIHNVNSCTSDPFGFGVKSIKDSYNVDRVYGTIYFGKEAALQKVEFGDNYSLNINS